MDSKQQVAAAVSGVAAMAEAIRELGSVPSGTLYANLCGSLDIDQYQSIIGILERAELISVKNHFITWIGPNFAPKVAA